MTRIVTKVGQFVAIVAVAIAVLFVCDLAAAEKKAAPAAVPEANQPEQKVPAASVPAEPGEEFAACSPEYTDKQILAMTRFLGELSPELAHKIRPILLQCDYKVNDDLLSAIAAVQEEMAEMEFANAEQAKDFRDEKAKEIEIQIALSERPVKQAELKKLVGDLFEFRQRSMKSALADFEKQVEVLKKRIDERQKLKDQITDRKAKELIAGEHPEAEGKEPSSDPLSWD